MRKLFVVLLAGGLLVCVLPASAQAHVLLTDKSSHSSAILHISPDDNPVAGKEAGLFFEIQTSANLASSNRYQLSITDDSNNTVTVPVSINGQEVIARYIFPAAALYKLELKSSASQKAPHFLYSLRVSPGSAGAPANAQSAWAQPVIIAALAAAALLGIVFANNAKEIIKKSTF